MKKVLLRWLRGLVIGGASLSLLALGACGPEYAFREWRPVPVDGWVYADSLSFEPVIDDTLALYALYLEVEHTPTFPFQNLYVRIHTRFPDGQRLSEQVSLELADRAGGWYGDCGRATCRLRIPIQESAYFEQAGPYAFTLEQYTRRDTLPGVAGIGLAIERTGARPSPDAPLSPR